MKTYQEENFKTKERVFVAQPQGIYARYIKRGLDFILSLIAIIVLSPLLLLLTIVGAIAMEGNPFFVQERPGKDEKIFKLIKFRTMTNKKDKDGNLLPDDQRLTSYGRFIRKTSIDELPELVNILKGNMSVCGPRPLLVRDMTFMNDRQRKRHLVRPGLTGLAQTNGRNALDWEEKLKLDLIYVKKITLMGDFKILFDTVMQVIFRKKGLKDSEIDEIEVTDDYGDYLLKNGLVSIAEYNQKQEEARKLIEGVK